MRHLLFLVLVTIVSQSNGCGCPAGYQPMGGGKCVRRLDTKAYDYHTASSICHSSDGFLPSVTTAKENEALLAAADGRDILLGLDNHCKWDDGREFSFSNYEGEKTCKNNDGVTKMNLDNGRWFINDSVQVHKQIDTFLCTAACNFVCECPAGFEQKNGGLCVRNFNRYPSIDYESARALCHSHGAFLASVTNAQENAAVFAAADGHTVHLGLGKGCKWDDGREFSFSDYKYNVTCKNKDGPTMMWPDDGHWFINEMFGSNWVVCTAPCKFASTPTTPTVTSTRRAPTSTPTTPTVTSTRRAPIGASCGTTPVGPNFSAERIVDGQTAVPYSWPWQIVWCTSGWFGGCSLQCGGTVIDSGWVMTAGHCVYDDMNPKYYQVKAAVYKEDATSESGEQVSKVKAIHLHPDYEPRNHTNDIALIEMVTPLQYNDHVQPVCLPYADTAAISKPNSAYVTGWGATTDRAEISIQLRQVEVPFIDYPTCEKEYPGKIIENSMVCAGVEGLDSCQGDSGSPMVVQGGHSGRWFQVGIVSWGRGCGEKGEGGVYTRVTAFCDFIFATTSGKVSCWSIA